MLAGVIVGNCIFVCINFIGMASGMKCPPLKFYLPAWFATDVILAVIFR